MYVILIVLGSIALMIGSMVAGILSCWVLWSGFKRIGHPEWGPPIMLIPGTLALIGQLPVNEFLALALIFAGLAVVPFCAEGLAWRARRDHRDHDGPQEQGEVKAIDHLLDASDDSRQYPAIAGCICEARRPTPDELKKVALRTLRETFGAQYPILGFAERRVALRAAKAALEGSRSGRIDVPLAGLPVRMLTQRRSQD